MASEDTTRIASILSSQLPADVADDLGGHIRFIRDGASPGLRVHDGVAWKSFLGTLAFTPGSVLFTGPDGAAAQDNANLFWDDTNKRLGIGTASPSVKLHLKNVVAGANSFLIESDGGAGLLTRLVIENNAIEPVDMSLREVVLSLGLSTRPGVSFNFYTNAFYTPINIYRSGSTSIVNWQLNSSGAMTSAVGGVASSAWDVKVAGEANSRFNVDEFGKLSWGAGGASALDTILQRSAAGILKIDNNLVLGATSLLSAERVRFSGSGNTEVLIDSTGTGTPRLHLDALAGATPEVRFRSSVAGVALSFLTENVERMRLSPTGSLTLVNAGPHVIGGSLNVDTQLLMVGTFVGVTNVIGLRIQDTLVPPVGGFGYGTYLSPTINKAGSGTHPDFATLIVDSPIITAGAATLTNASTVKITGAPTDGVNNYAVWSVSGSNRFGGEIRAEAAIRSHTQINNLLDLVTSGNVRLMTTDGHLLLDVFNDTSDVAFRTGSALTTKMTLKNTGILALGTSVTTGAATGDLVLAAGKNILSVNNAATGTISLIRQGVLGAIDFVVLADSRIVSIGVPASITSSAPGDLVLSNLNHVRFVNNAGTNTIRSITVNAADELELAPGGNDIRWGRALVALGGGAAPTLGTIGGSGPVTAAQNTWMRVVDSAGAAFWVPAWK